MRPITAEQMLDARIKLGRDWGLGRQLTTGEIGHLVGLSEGSASDTIRQIEDGKRPASGPVSLVVLAMLDGWVPPHRDAAFKSTKASTSPRGPFGMNTNAPAAGKPAGRKVIGTTEPATWAGDPKKDQGDDGEG